MIRFTRCTMCHARHTARRTKKQIFLSVDVPPTFLSGGGAGQGGQTLLEVEKALIGVLKELEAKGNVDS